MAGRKNKNTVDYFPHYVTAGRTRNILENQFGNEGYAILFKTLELLGSNENHYIDLRSEADLLYLMSILKATESTINSVYNLLAKLGTIDADLWNEKIIFSENFIENIKDVYVRRNNKCMHKLDLCKHLNIKCKQKLPTNGINDGKNTQSKVKYSKVKESKEKEKPSKKKKSEMDILINSKPQLKENLLGFIEMRKSIKKPMTLQALKILITKLEAITSAAAVQNQILEQSILNNWQSVYELKHEPKRLPTPAELDAEDEAHRKKMEKIWAEEEAKMTPEEKAQQEKDRQAFLQMVEEGRKNENNERKAQ